MARDLVALGLNAVDVLIRLPAQIRRDDKQLVNDLLIQGGAPTASGACGVARLGYDVAYVARVGSNTLSAACIEEFRKSGVSVDLFIYDDHSRPALALVEIDPVTAGRTVFIQMDNYGYLRPGDIPLETICSSRALLVDSYDLDATEAALQAAVGTGCRSILDFESGDHDRMRRLLSIATDPILPIGCARKLTDRESPEDVILGLAALTPGQPIVTDGISGSWALNRARGEILHQHAFRVPSLDSTGCGDAFHAGYIVGLLEGWELPIRMEFAALLASRVSTQIGGRTALPRRNEILSLLRSDVSRELRSLIKDLHDHASL